jgi:putative membrane protein
VSLLLRLLINAAALYAATRLVDGLQYSGEPAGLLAVALVFGLVNTFIAPILKFFSLPLIFLTLGIFALIINGLMLMLTARWATALGFPFSVDDFGSAFWGALCISIVSMLLGALIRDDKKEKAGR